MSTRSTSPVASLAEKAPEPKFYVVSVKKMIVMLIFSMGLYFWYWNYRNWKNYRRVTGEPVIPLLRAIFYLFFLHALLERVDRGLRSQSASVEWSPRLLVVGVITSVVYSIFYCNLLPLESALDWVMSTFGLYAVYLLNAFQLLAVFLYFAQLWLMARIQRVINLHESDPHATGNNRLTGVDWFWMLPGILVLLGAIVFLIFLFYAFRII
ncbi:hypothetical protein [Pseudomonas sp. zfem002]|uniref:hypothetical protein n=1 Tax=Pseudomonas sp. zfem002 TaxID=3078197 RepID=UPI002928F666|nr:hypothetical protein [Pseudomonas sp. zfem002]MDU9391761.1 hypothetical protein [Pseudomonas sp. zfem002]